VHVRQGDTPPTKDRDDSMSVADTIDEKSIRPGRAMVTAAMLLAMAVTALEQTVVSTAMPSIIAALKGLDIYPWVFSAYLLAATVSTPIYGKLADIWGRKRILLFGLGLFSVGSILSGQANSMGMLIAMRVVQGLGAGAIGPIVLTMIGDMFTLKERAVVQSLFSTVWGVASLAGPALGGVLTDRLSWRWVFYVTVPFGIVSAWVLVRHVDEKISPKRVAPIDWPGALLLTLGSTSLLLAVLQGHDASALRVGICLAIAAVILVAFVVRERHAADPMLPLDLIGQGVIGASIVGSFAVGVLLFGLDTFIPLYVQGVRGGSATEAGWTMTPMLSAWAVSVFVSVWVVIAMGFRTTAMVGGTIITLGVACVTAGVEWPAWSRPLFLVGMIVIGLGFGPTSLSFILCTQHSVDWGRRGVATGAVTFFRTMGGALGVGLLGAVLGYELSNRLGSAGALGVDVAAALRPETHANLPPDVLALVQHALGRSLRDVFLLMTAVALTTIFAAAFLTPGHPSPPGEAKPGEGAEDFALAAVIE
jgi:Na+/melibiose symporter-like transporter